MSIQQHGGQMFSLKLDGIRPELQRFTLEAGVNAEVVPLKDMQNVKSLQT